MELTVFLLLVLVGIGIGIWTISLQLSRLNSAMTVDKNSEKLAEIQFELGQLKKALSSISDRDLRNGHWQQRDAAKTEINRGDSDETHKKAGISKDKKT